MDLWRVGFFFLAGIIIIIIVAAAFLNEMNGVFQFNWCLNLIDVAFIFN